jgi:hypothetical protein
MAASIKEEWLKKDVLGFVFEKNVLSKYSLTSN